MVDELIRTVISYQGLGTAGGQLYLKMLNKFGKSRFLSFECTNLEGDLQQERLAKAIETAENANCVTLVNLEKAFFTWRPTKVSSVLPPSLREMMLNWMIAEADNDETCALPSSGKWIIGGFLVWLDVSTSPEPRFRYCILSTMTGVSRFAAWQIDQQDSKRTRLLADSSEKDMLQSLVDYLGPHPPAPLDVPQELVEEEKEARRCALIRNLLVFIIIFVLVLLLGKWLWNKTLVPSVTFARPLTSIWPLLGIIVLIGILRGGR